MGRSGRLIWLDPRKGGEMSGLLGILDVVHMWVVACRVGSGASPEVGCHADGVVRMVWYTGGGIQARSG